jgi:hypothetical protein
LALPSPSSTVFLFLCLLLPSSPGVPLPFPSFGVEDPKKKNRRILRELVWIHGSPRMSPCVDRILVSEEVATE